MYSFCILLFLPAAVFCFDSSLPYGAVNFTTSCDPRVEDDFNTAVSMMYSFWYSESLILFNDISARDPNCCMSYWGAAATYNHPVWDFIQDDRLAAAGGYAEQASTCAQTNQVTARELGYIDSMTVYMDTSNPALNDPATRLQAYVDDFNSRVYIPFGTIDENAGVMYGLALIGVGYYSETEPEDGFPSLSLAGLTEERVVLGNPDSPGALHYVIHAYDQPSSAYRALTSAYRYLNASTSVPHALHMPSHIFSDLGLWSDMVYSNVLSLNKAFELAGEPTGDWYHGSYFLQFGMLQLAMDCDALSMMQAMQNLAVSNAEGFGAEAAIRIPGSYYVETRDWEAAAAFDLVEFYGDTVSDIWDQNPWTIIEANFIATAGRAILDYPVEHITAARQKVDDANVTLLSDPSWKRHQLPYWRLSFNQMVWSARAWETFRVVGMDEGIAAMEATRQLQLTTWAPEVAHAWDANEQMAEMYLIRNNAGDVEKALEMFEAAIAMYPNRYRSNAGAAAAADALGNDIKASLYYGNLLTLTSAPYPNASTIGVIRDACAEYAYDRRPELVDANNYFASMNSKDEGSSVKPNYSVYAWVFAGTVAMCALVAVSYHCYRQSDKDGMYKNYKAL